MTSSPDEPGPQDGFTRRIMKMMPGVTKEMRSAANNVDEGELNKIEAIIRSMTKRERREPVIIDGSRRTRIARGSGTTVSAVNQLLKQFNEMRKMMRQMSSARCRRCPGYGSDGEQGGEAPRGEALPRDSKRWGGNEGRATGSKRWRQKQEEERRRVTPPNNAKL